MLLSLAPFLRAAEALDSTENLPLLVQAQQYNHLSVLINSVGAVASQPPSPQAVRTYVE